MKSVAEIIATIRQQGLSQEAIVCLNEHAENDVETAWLLATYFEDPGPFQDRTRAEALYRKIATSPFYRARLADFLSDRAYLETALFDDLAALNFSIFLRQ